MIIITENKTIIGIIIIVGLAIGAVLFSAKPSRSDIAGGAKEKPTPSVQTLTSPSPASSLEPTASLSMTPSPTPQMTLTPEITASPTPTPTLKISEEYLAPLKQAELERFVAPLDATKDEIIDKLFTEGFIKSKEAFGTALNATKEGDNPIESGGYKIALISLQKPFSSVLIENEEIYLLVKFMFDSLWKELEGKNLPDAKAIEEVRKVQLK